MTKYRVWCPDAGDEEDGHDTEGFDAQHAAQEYVADRERRGCEYHVAGGDSTLEVSVRDGDAVKRFTVSGWAEPTYHATLLKD